MKRCNHLTLLIGLLVTVVLGACAEQTSPMPNLDGEDLDFLVETSTPTTALPAVLPDGIPCHELFEPAREGDLNGALLPDTFHGDLVGGWAFTMKQPTGFKDHGCQIVGSPHPCLLYTSPSPRD